MTDVQKPTPRKFLKSTRLLKHADFQAVYKLGRRHFSSNISAFYRRRDDNAGPRVGLTVGKVLGGAVQRNRIRRRLRAAVGQRLALLDRAVDVVLHPRKAVAVMDFGKLESEVEQIFASIQKAETK
ncbi:MAG TPA: ribonuclease P protein component [Alphaproteobacteria bacterium]|nr:ribonuclease P protein component [Alphaproteobacteria bacterium]